MCDSHCFDELAKYVKWFNNALFCVDIVDFKENWYDNLKNTKYYKKVLNHKYYSLVSGY